MAALITTFVARLKWPYCNQSELASVAGRIADRPIEARTFDVRRVGNREPALAIAQLRRVRNSYAALSAKPCKYPMGSFVTISPFLSVTAAFCYCRRFDCDVSDLR